MSTVESIKRCLARKKTDRLRAEIKRLKAEVAALKQWRDEHDRVVREYQHRLMVIGASAVEATSYPENAKSAGTDASAPNL